MQYMKFLFASFVATMLISCTSEEIGNSKDVAQESIYQEYSVTYHEGDIYAKIEAQFRFGGFRGTTLVLNPPSSFKFDGKELHVDSADYKGAYYSLDEVGHNAYGAHSLLFTDINGKKYENLYTLDHFRIVAMPAGYDASKDILISFDSSVMKRGDEINIGTKDTDSSFTVRHSVDDRGYTVAIPAEELKKQKGQEFTLEIFISRKVPLQHETKEGGELKITYKLKPLKIRKI